MKRLLVFIMVLVSICGLSGCNGNVPEESPGVESVSSDYGKVIELAKAEFNEVFKEFENLKIEETTTMARTDEAKEIHLKSNVLLSGIGLLGRVGGTTNTRVQDIFDGGLYEKTSII